MYSTAYYLGITAYVEYVNHPRTSSSESLLIYEVTTPATPTMNAGYPEEETDKIHTEFSVAGVVHGGFLW